MLDIPARTRADLLLWTALYGGLLLGAVTKVIVRHLVTVPAPVEVPDAAVVPE